MAGHRYYENHENLRFPDSEHLCGAWPVRRTLTKELPHLHDRCMPHILTAGSTARLKSSSAVCVVCTSVHLCASAIALHLCPLLVLQYGSSFSLQARLIRLLALHAIQRPTLADAAAPLNGTTCALLHTLPPPLLYTHTPTLRTLSLSHTHACRQSGQTGRCREPSRRCARRARQPPTRSRQGNAHALSYRG